MMAQCKRCGKEFEPYGRQLFCSVECRETERKAKLNAHRPMQKTCVVCGAVFAPFNDRQVYCSKSCCSRKNNEEVRRIRQQKRTELKPKSKPGVPIKDVVKAAMASGMTYGKYVQRYGLK